MASVGRKYFERPEEDQYVHYCFGLDSILNKYSQCFDTGKNILVSNICLFCMRNRLQPYAWIESLLYIIESFELEAQLKIWSAISAAQAWKILEDNYQYTLMSPLLWNHTPIIWR